MTVRACLIVAVFLQFFGSASPVLGASLDKAARLMAEDKWPEARKQFEAVIRKGSAPDLGRAYLGLAQTYFMEKDFQGLLRSLAPFENKIPETPDGVWIRVFLYRAARQTGDAAAIGRNVQTLLRFQPDFPVRDMAEHIRLLNDLGLIKSSLLLPPDSATEPVRQALVDQAEGLSAADIASGAIRIWTAVAAVRPDRIGQNALFRLAQALDGEGDPDLACRYLKLYALFFPEDSRTADALYRVAKWSTLRSSGDFRIVTDLIRRFYPNSLYGAAIAVETARAWPQKGEIRDMVQILRSSPGLPETFLEPGLATAIQHADWLASDDDRVWIAQRYLISFPFGPQTLPARSLLSNSVSSSR